MLFISEYIQEFVWQQSSIICNSTNYIFEDLSNKDWVWTTSPNFSGLFIQACIIEVQKQLFLEVHLYSGKDQFFFI